MGRSAAASLAAVVLAAVVLAAVVVFSAVGRSDAAVYLSVKNSLPGRMRLYCWSNLQTRPTVDLDPGQMWGFDIRAGIDHDAVWSCNFSGPDSYTGMFVLWRSRGGPCYSPSACPWVADDYGLSLTRYDGYVEHVYRWP